MKAKNLNFVALDIGSSKIAGVAANIDKKGEIKILSQTLQYSAGFKSSAVTDLNAAEESILRAVYYLEKECDKSIKQATISLSGYGTKSYYINSQVKINSQSVGKTDIKRLIAKALSEFKVKNKEVILYFPIEFGLDDNNSIENPVGMFGKELRCQLHVIAATSNLMLNLTNCFAKCQIEITDVILGIYASGLSCLSEDEKNLGSLIVDFGAKTTSYGIFLLGKLVYTGWVDLGGFHITSDIAKVFSLNFATAEKLKILYGNADPTSFEKDKVINIDELEADSLYNLHNIISVKELSNVIQSRLEEILIMIKEQYEQISIDHLIARRLVMTGGASSLRGIKEFTGKFFNKQVRVAKPQILPNFSEDHNPPSYSTLIGMVQNYSQKQIKSSFEGIDDSKHQFINKIIGWVKENI